MVAAVAFGVTITATVQVVMSTIEVALLLLFAILAIFHGNKVHEFSWHWFAPSAIPSTTAFFAGALIAAFYSGVGMSLQTSMKRPRVHARLQVRAH
jgi:uncharacterized integral membrane protein